MDMKQSKVWGTTTEMKLFRANAPLESVAIDFLEELIEKTRGNCYILVIYARLNNLVRTIPMKNDSAEEVARKFTK